MSRAIVISGAAARGAFSAGVLAGLGDDACEAIYGTSSGALNSVLYAYGGKQLLFDEWASISSIDDVYEFNGWDALWLPGLYNNTPLYRRVLKVTGGKRPRMPVCVTVANLNTGQAEYWCRAAATSLQSDPVFAAAVAQSASIPGLCCDLNDWNRVDGGIIVNLPIQKALEEGHDDITLILDQPYQEAPDSSYDQAVGVSALSEAVRIFNMMFWAQTWQLIQACLPRCKSLTVYAPKPIQLRADYLDFRQETIRSTIMVGLATPPSKTGI